MSTYEITPVKQAINYAVMVVLIASLLFNLHLVVQLDRVISDAIEHGNQSVAVIDKQDEILAKKDEILAKKDEILAEKDITIENLEMQVKLEKDKLRIALEEANKSEFSELLESGKAKTGEFVNTFRNFYGF